MFWRLSLVWCFFLWFDDRCLFLLFIMCRLLFVVCPVSCVFCCVTIAVRCVFRVVCASVCDMDCWLFGACVSCDLCCLLQVVLMYCLL